MNLKFKFILITELVLFLNFVVLPDINEHKDDGDSKMKKAEKFETITNAKFPVRQIFDWNKQYERTIQFIKEHEGFAGGKAYVCPGGHRTIGYGHVILKGETYTKISKVQADSLLRDDFSKALKVLDETIHLQGPQRLAMAHFVFAKGIGSFNRSTLKKKILANQPIDKEIVKWCYYTDRKGEKIKSQNALNIRKWELKLYNLKG